VTDLPAVVIDTNLFVAAGFNPASDAARVLAAIRAGGLRLVWNASTRRETESIVGKIPPLAGTDLSDLSRPNGRYDGPTRPDAFASVPDPDDRKFAALAAATGAVLLTRDRHLLDGRPHSEVVVLTPGEFVRQVWGEGRGVLANPPAARTVLDWCPIHGRPRVTRATPACRITAVHPHPVPDRAALICPRSCGSHSPVRADGIVIHPETGGG
jgi:predicted nucleic acid-binding protein